MEMEQSLRIVLQSQTLLKIFLEHLRRDKEEEQREEKEKGCVS